MRSSRFQLNESIPSINPAWYTEEADSPFFRFQWLSVGFHACLLILCFWIELPKLAPVPIEIEILDSPAPSARPKDRGSIGEPSSKSVSKTKAVAAKVTAPIKTTAIVEQKAEVDADALLSEIEESTEQVLAADETETGFDPSVLEESFDQLKAESDSNTREAVQAFASSAEALMEDSEIAVNEAKDLLKADQKLQAQQTSESRKKALAKEIAASRFEAQAAKKAAANRAAVAKAAAAAAAAARAAEQAKAAGTAGNGGVGSARPAGIGVGGSIRSLDQLKQQPGNKRPRYDVEDRMAGREGPVTLVAYVADSGNIQKLKMVQSSGHRTLDNKTLEAIKVWKFYPGQAGWVEIPIQWDLKGGPQEKPTQLRRKVTTINEKSVRTNRPVL